MYMIPVPGGADHLCEWEPAYRHSKCLSSPSVPSVCTVQPASPPGQLLRIALSVVEEKSSRLH